VNKFAIADAMVNGAVTVAMLNLGNLPVVGSPEFEGVKYIGEAIADEYFGNTDTTGDELETLLDEFAIEVVESLGPAKKLDDVKYVKSQLFALGWAIHLIDKDS